MTRAALLAAMTLATTPLAAQHPGMADTMRHPMMGAGAMAGMMGDPMMQEMGPAMMKMMLYTPQHLLARKDALGLGADQVARLTALEAASKAARETALAQAQAHLKELEQAADAAAPDTAALKTHFEAAHAAMGKAHWAMLESAAQARAVLSDGQRGKVQVWADSMQAWMQQHRRMMNPNGAH